jgi:thioredoxin-like negative regulator of GroEL
MTALFKKFLSSWERFHDGMTEAQVDAARAVAVVLVVGVLGVGGYFLGRPLWLRWQNREALAQAETFSEEKDYQSMLLALRRATQSAPNDPTTWKQVIHYLAAIASPETILTAREQLIRLTPQDMAVRVALVQDALKAGRYDTANAALAGFDDAARRDAAFFRLAVAVAVAEGQPSVLQDRLAKLTAADPSDLNARFTYAALRLWNPDASVRDAARAELEGLIPDRSYRIRAAIELLSEAARRNDTSGIQGLLARLLDAFSPGTPADFSAPAVPGWAALVDGMKAASAAGAPSDSALVARWLADMGRRREAIAWLERLPSVSRSDPVVADTAAELVAEEQDLPQLDRLLRDGAWGAWPDETRLLALSSHLEMLRFDAERGHALWSDAVASSADSLHGLRALVRLANAWHDPDGAELALRKILDRDPRIFWAYDALRTSYVARGDLTRLWQLYGQWVQEAPDDREITAQWILLSCILNRGTSDAYPHATHLTTDSSAGILARAAVLWRQGSFDAAHSLLMDIPEQQRREPAIAFWVALVAADLNLRGEAAQAIEEARKAPMPTEQLALLQDASDKIKPAQ